MDYLGRCTVLIDGTRPTGHVVKTGVAINTYDNTDCFLDQLRASLRALYRHECKRLNKPERSNELENPDAPDLGELQTGSIEAV